MSQQRVILVLGLLGAALLDILLLWICAAVGMINAADAMKNSGSVMQLSFAPLATFGIGSAAAAELKDPDKNAFVVAAVMMSVWFILVAFPPVLMFVIPGTFKIENFPGYLDLVSKYATVLPTGALAFYFAKAK